MSRLGVLDRAPVDLAAPAPPTNGEPHERPSDRPLASRGVGAALTGLGLAAIAVVVLALVVARIAGGAAAAPRRGPPEVTAVVSPTTVPTSGPVDLSLQTMSYMPGQSSGWHTHPGMHLVSVVSGTLTVVGADCQPQTFGPGQSYLGGELLHLARNETGAPLEMAVTYVTQPGQSMGHFRIEGAPPADCPIS